MQEAVCLTLKTEIMIDRSESGICRVGGVKIPTEILIPSEDPSVLVLAKPWVVEAGMRVPDNRRFLHRCISSRNPGEKRTFFIPITFLLEPRTEAFR